MALADRQFGLRFAAWGLALLGSLLNLLNHNEYPLANPEVAIVGTGAISAAILLAVVHRAAMPRLSFLFTALLIGLAVDLNSTSLPLALGAFAAGLVAAWFRDNVTLKLVAAAFFGVTFLQLLQAQWRPAQAAPSPAVEAARSELPPIVHIVFDGYLGIDGMAADEASFGRLRKENLAFFTDHGFRLYGGAYSRHRNTTNSLPQIFSFGTAPLATGPQRKQHFTLGTLPYFTALRERGYRTRVYQTDYIDLCSGRNADECRTFRRSDLSAIASTGMPAAQKAETIASTFAGLALIPSAVFSAASKARARLTGAAHVDLHQRGKLFPIASMKAMSELESALERAAPGEAYVAHFLIPHDPFLYDAQCGVRPRREWTFEGMPADRARRERDYAEQMRCVLSRIERVVAALGRSPAGERAVVIVHGDHGSRIVDTEPVVGSDASPRDFAMTYSTLFAVRAPGIAPGSEPGRAPVAHLLGDLAKSHFRRAPQANSGDAHVLLADDQWVPRQKAPLPPFGTAGINP